MHHQSRPRKGVSFEVHSLGVLVLEPGQVGQAALHRPRSETACEGVIRWWMSLQQTRPNPIDGSSPKKIRPLSPHSLGMSPLASFCAAAATCAAMIQIHRERMQSANAAPSQHHRPRRVGLDHKDDHLHQKQSPCNALHQQSYDQAISSQLATFPASLSHL